MLAIAAQAILPLAVSTSANAAANGERVAVCTSLGLVWVSLSDSASADGNGHGHLHCPFCAGGAPLPMRIGARAGFAAPGAEALRGHKAGLALPASRDALPPPSRGPPALA
ncbi:MAG: hypothetical protein R3E87_20660 [Burkholderiaceae bacterium]